MEAFSIVPVEVMKRAIGFWWAEARVRLNILEYMGEPPPTSHQVPNVNSAKGEKPCLGRYN